MDFETWLATPHHPPSELLTAIAHSRAMQDLAPFVGASPERTAWFEFFQMSDPHHFKVMAKLPEYYEARDACELANTKFQKAAVDTAGANYMRSLVEAKRGHLSVCEMSSRASHVHAAMRVAYNTVEEYKRAEDDARKDWVECIGRLAVLKAQIRSHFK